MLIPSSLPATSIFFKGGHWEEKKKTTEVWREKTSTKVSSSSQQSNSVMLLITAWDLEYLIQVHPSPQAHLAIISQ